MQSWHLPNLAGIVNGRLTDGDRDPHETDDRYNERPVGSCSACAVRCLLLRERAEAKRRGELELMRNEQDDGGPTERGEVDMRLRRMPQSEALLRIRVLLSHRET